MDHQVAIGLGLVLGSGLMILMLVLARPSQKDLLVRISPAAAGYRSPALNTQVLAGKKTPPLVKLLISIRSQNKQRIHKALLELPEILDLLSVAIASGDSIYRALTRVAPRANGVLAKELQRLIQALELGSSLETEIAELPKAIPHPQIAEFANKVAMAHVRGTPLASMLRDQSLSVRSEIRNRLLKQAGQNETRMLIPLVFLILPVTVMFAIYPSLKLINLSYF